MPKPSSKATSPASATPRRLEAGLRASGVAGLLGLVLTACGPAGPAPPAASHPHPPRRVVEQASLPSPAAPASGEPGEDRWAALQAAAAEQTPAGRATLLAATRDPLPALRVAAVEALATQTDRTDFSAVAGRLLHEDPAPEVRAAAVALLSPDGDPSLWSAAAADGSPMVRQAALWHLEGASAATRLAAAQPLATSSNPDQRRTAAFVLGGTPAKPAVDALLTLLGDPAAREVAREGLLFLVGQDFSDPAAARAWWQAHQAGFSPGLEWDAQAGVPALVLPTPATGP